MKKIVIAAALAAAVLGADSIQGKQFKYPRGGMTRNYNPDTEVTIDGTIEKIIKINRAGRKAKDRGMHILLKNKRRAIEAHLGPSWYIEGKVSLKKGDRVKVTGSRVGYALKDVIIVRQLTKDGNTVILRNKKGLPLWAGKGIRRGFRR